ncbi:MAG TPA: biotin carboxylase N-terminal domain-containing protein, partial [Myxococcota bacterium]|nr:biotin carboxylase N-terminal domain-containing protein [Myxococcota bacterium]
MKILVANRGEIACRLIAGIRELGHEAVAVFTDVDADAPHVRLADHAIGLGEPRAYLDIAKLIDAMKATGAKAVHPGYGFVSQSAEFVEACDAAKVTFIGPSAKAMRALGD